MLLQCDHNHFDLHDVVISKLCKIYSRIMTSKHGIRICFFSSKPRKASNPLPAPTLAVPGVILLRIASIAVPAREPPVPFIAETATLAVCNMVSVIVAFPLMNDVILSLTAVV